MSQRLGRGVGYKPRILSKFSNGYINILRMADDQIQHAIAAVLKLHMVKKQPSHARGHRKNKRRQGESDKKTKPKAEFLLTLRQYGERTRLRHRRHRRRCCCEQG